MGEIRSKYTSSIDLLKAAGVSTLAVANTDTAYSYSFLLKPKRSFGLEVKFKTASGNPNVKIELEAGGSEPDTNEGAADTDFVVPQALGGGTNPDAVIDSGANTTLVRFYPVPPVVAPFQRFKFTGISGNQASTEIERLILHEIES